MHLGCSEAEKQNAQMVSFNIEFIFKATPLGTKTDNLDDTICYFKITNEIQSLCESKRFNLVEHLAYEAYQKIIKFLGQNNHGITSLKVTIHKLAPPVPGVHGGVKFTYTENIQ